MVYFVAREVPWWCCSYDALIVDANNQIAANFRAAIQNLQRRGLPRRYPAPLAARAFIQLSCPALALIGFVLPICGREDSVAAIYLVRDLFFPFCATSGHFVFLADKSKTHPGGRSGPRWGLKRPLVFSGEGWLPFACQNTRHAPRRSQTDTMAAPCTPHGKGRAVAPPGLKPRAAEGDTSRVTRSFRWSADQIRSSRFHAKPLQLAAHWCGLSQARVLG